MPFDAMNNTAAPDSVLDIVTLRSAMADDDELVAEILTVFVSEIPGMLNELRQAADSLDNQKLEHAAHSIKGACANIRAEKARQLALDFEMDARQNQIKDVPAQVATMEAAMEEIHQAIAKTIDIPSS